MSYMFQRPIISHGSDDTDTTSATTMIANAVYIQTLAPNLALVTTANGQLVTSTVTASQLGTLVGTTSNIQAQLNARANLTGATFSGPVALSGQSASRVVVFDANQFLANSATTAAELGYLSGTTSAVQTQLNTRANITGATFSGPVALSGQSASRVAVFDGSSFLANSATTAAELGFLSGTTSAVQTQLNDRANLVGATFSGPVALSGQTASRVAVFDGSSALANSVTTATELGYLSGTTSSVQTQLNARANIAGATFSGPVALSGQTASRVAVFDANQFLANSVTTATELGYLSGATSSVQTQLNARANIAGATFNGPVAFSGQTASRVAVFDANQFLANSVTTATELGYLSGTTSNIQTQLNAKQATITGAASTVLSSDLTVSRAVVSDGAGKLANSIVTATELGYLGGATSNIQAQLNTKSSVIGAASTVVTSDLTASRVVVSDASGKLANSIVTDTELGYLSGATSNIQAQLNTKQATITGAASTVVSSDLTVSRAVVSDGAGKLANSVVTAAELDYLTGATSNIQTQLDTKANLAGATFSGPLALTAQTADRAAYFDGSKALAACVVTTAELGYLSGSRTSLQTQIDAKANVADPTFQGNAVFKVSAANSTIVAQISPGGSFMTSTMNFQNDVIVANGRYLVLDGTNSSLDVSGAATWWSGSSLTLTVPSSFYCYCIAYLNNEVQFGNNALPGNRVMYIDTDKYVRTSNVTPIELNYLSGVSSNVQTQLNARQTTITGAATTITSSDLTTNRALASDGAGKVGVSTVTATELGYVGGATSNIQAQLNARANIAGATFSGPVALSGQTASRVAVFDANKALANSLTTAAELGYLVGATSNIQTQLDARANIASATFSGPVALSGQTASRVVVFDANKALANSLTTAAELLHLGGATSNIQAQLNARANITGASFSGAVVLSNQTGSRVAVFNASSALANSLTTAAELGYLGGATSNIQAQLNARANIAGADFTGDISTTKLTTTDLLAVYGIGVTGVDVGPMCDKYYGDGDRYGIGQFPGGITRVYASNVSSTGRILLGFTTGATHNDIVTVERNANTTITGNVILSGTSRNLSWGTPTVKNNMLTLYGNADPDAVSNYGFGINSNTLRYNAGTSSSHTFFVSGTAVCNLSASGLLLGSGGQGAAVSPWTLGSRFNQICLAVEPGSTANSQPLNDLIGGNVYAIGTSISNPVTANGTRALVIQSQRDIWFRANNDQLGKITTGNVALNGGGYATTSEYPNWTGKLWLPVGNTQTSSLTSNTAATHQITLGYDSAFKPTTTTWTTSSDARLKSNIELANLDTLWGIVKRLDLKRYEWRPPVCHLTGDKTMLGWVAQDVAQVFPKAVNTVPMYDIEDCMTLNDDQLHKVTYGALKLAVQRIEALEERVAALEAR